MPISILELAHARDRTEQPFDVTIDTLSDVDLHKPLSLHGVVTKLDYDTFLVSVSGAAYITAACDRCLSEVVVEVSISLTLTFTDHPTEDEWPIERNNVEISPAVRDEILLQMPLQNLCRTECKVFTNH